LAKLQARVWLLMHFARLANTLLKDGSRHRLMPPYGGSIVTERIEYRLLSLTYKVLTTTQPSYLHNLITVQPLRSTRSSLVTLARPSTSSSPRITDRSFQYASPRLWNQLSAFLRQPSTNLSNSDSPSPTSGTSPIGSIDSLLSSSITPSLFHSRLKKLPFLLILPTVAFLFFFRTDSTDSPDCLVFTDTSEHICFYVITV